MTTAARAEAIIGELEPDNLIVASDNEPRLNFFGGPWVSFLPFALFTLFIITTTFVWSSSSDGALWLPPFLALVISFFFAKDKTRYTEVVVEGMASKEALLPVVCWLFAGTFSGILKASGLATALAGIATDIGLSAVAFIVVSFLTCALFATAAGTGFGTIAVGMGVLYPAGVALGCHPGLLAGAVVSGAAFGDNVAPISDTTICSATTQGVDIPGVVRSRLKYAIPAALMAVAGFIALGLLMPGSGHANASIGSIDYDPVSLLMMLSVIATIVVAAKTGNIITATCIGIVLGSLIGVATDQFDCLLLDAGEAGANALVTVGDASTGHVVGGVLYDGLSSMIQMCIMILLLFGAIAVMRQGGGDKLLIARLTRIASTPRRAEVVISLLTIGLSSIVGHNAPTILAIGPTLAKPLSRKLGISPYRTANLLDAQSNTLLYALPWTPAILLTVGFTVGTTHPLIPLEITPYVFYGYTLMLVMFVTIALGVGRQDSANGARDSRQHNDEGGGSAHA